MQEGQPGKRQEAGQPEVKDALVWGKSSADSGFPASVGGQGEEGFGAWSWPCAFWEAFLTSLRLGAEGLP